MLLCANLPLNSRYCSLSDYRFHDVGGRSTATVASQNAREHGLHEHSVAVRQHTRRAGQRELLDSRGPLEQSAVAGRANYQHQLQCVLRVCGHAQHLLD